MKIFIVVNLSILLLGISSCKKEKSNNPIVETQTGLGIIPDSLYQGLPPGPVKVNGYFYGCMFGATSGGRSMYAFAAFSNSRKNLTVNYNKYKETNIIDTTDIVRNLSDAYGGDIKFNTGHMNFLQMRPATYIMVLTGNFNMEPTWTISGSGLFIPFVTVIKRGFPVIKPSVYTYSLQTGKDFTMPLDSIANCDSISVELRGNLTYKQVYKSVNPSMKQVTLTASELMGLKYDTYGTILIRTYNYSYKMQANQLYLFELANKYVFNYIYVP